MRGIIAALVIVTLLAACAPGAVAPLDRQVAALPTPEPVVDTATPPPSVITLPTVAPTVVGPLATLTALGGLLPTVDANATPYAIAYRGVPVFIEFQARW